jgi:hypothetical protein
MLRMLPRLALRLLAALVPLALAACADTLTSGQPPMASNAELQRDYDRTMTKTEQAAAISDLAQEKQKQDQFKQDGAGAAGTTAPTPAASATSSKSAAKSAAKPAAAVGSSSQAY